MSTAYRGRFAPSPTGPLHQGSLVAAVASYLEAQRHGGEWHVRIEDLDTPRAVPGAAADILRTLEGFGLHWDGPVLYQSQRHEAYEAALQALEAAGWTYPCGCTRREILTAGRRGTAGAIYPGTCRNGLPAGRRRRALRVRSDGAHVTFDDLFQGRCSEAVADALGDFALHRGDGRYAYHLAVVVDDAWQGITHVIRGSDLLPLTPPQIHLQRLLGLPTPAYGHHPVAVDAAGEKLSKHTDAAPLDTARPGPALVWALGFLNMPVEPGLARASVGEIWTWAAAHWDPARVPRRTRLGGGVAA